MAKSSLSRSTDRSKRQPDAGSSGPQEREHVIWVPPLGVPRAGTPAEDAVVVFERAVRSMQRHHYAAALTEFQGIEERFPEERALLDRARVYAALCRRELDRPVEGGPRTIEERLTAATAALNNGDNQRAEHLVSQVLEDVPGHDLGHYLLAVVHVRRGATAAALDALRHAIKASPEVRVQARHDADFAPLRGNEAFERMVADRAAQSDARHGS